MTGVALGISASDRSFSVAIRDVDGVITTAHPEATGAGDLTATVAALFDDQGHSPSEITELRLDVGPGSYTGLRVAVTFARVTSAFRDVPILTATSLELAALAVWNRGDISTDQVLRPVLDARRHRFHHAPVRCHEHVELVADPIATEFEVLAAAIGSEETLLAEVALHERLSTIHTSILAPIPWDAAALFDARLRPRITTTDALEPLYLMGSYAE